MTNDIIQEYLCKIEHEHRAVEELLSSLDNDDYAAVFAYGNPMGDDIDLCFITAERYKVEPLEKDIYDNISKNGLSDYNFDITVATLADFIYKMRKEGHKAVEFRVSAGKTYLHHALKRPNIKVPLRDYNNILKDDHEELGFLL